MISLWRTQSRVLASAKEVVYMPNFRPVDR